MNKSDLKSGDLVKRRDGSIGIVLLNCKDWSGVGNIILNLQNGYNLDLDNYNDDLTTKSSMEDFDILEVCSKEYVGDNFRLNNLLKENGKNFTSTWKREGKKEMTIAEIEEKLGYSIKIIKEN